MNRSPSLGAFRSLMFLAAALYLGWWFMVRTLDPSSFNPLISRLVVVALILIATAFSWTEYGKKNCEVLYYACNSLITLHFFYLLDVNASNAFWVEGAFITLFAIVAGIFSRAFLMFYSIGWMILSMGLYWRNPELWKNSILLSGFITILVVANIFMRGRHKLFDDLTESTLRFETLFDSMFEGIALHDKGIILDANTPLGQLFGYKHEELLGRDIRSLVARNQIPLVDSRLIANVEETFQAEGRTKNGSQFPIEIQNRHFEYQKKKLGFVSIVDISPRIEAETKKLALVKAEFQRETVEEALKLRDDFISIASHELKTPLTPLKMQLQMLLKNLEAEQSGALTKEKMSQMLSIANQQVERLERLVELLLNSTYLMKGKLELTPSHFSLLKVLNEVMDIYKDEAARSETVLHLELFPDIVVYWDKVRFEQAVGNLLRNAIGFGRKNPISIRVVKDDKRVKISVVDKGIGIAKEDLSRIFSRFERAVSHRNFGGLGLGLFLVKEMVTAHRGVIFVTSEEGVGSTFTIDLPQNPFIAPTV